MRLIPRQSLWTLILFILIGAPVTVQAAEPTTTPRTIKVEATAQAGGAIDKGDPRVVSSLLVNSSDGGALEAGVLMQMDPHWHVYWRHSGEAGLPTQITWRAQLNGAWKDLGQTISWPAPETFTESGGTITTYGYADEVLHTFALPKTIKAPVTLEAKVNFLTCAKICIPGDVVLRRTIDANHKNAHSDIFEHFAKRIPKPASSRGWKVTTQPTTTYPGDQPLLALTLTCEDAAQCGAAVLASKDTKALVPDAKNQITWKPVRLTPNTRGDGWTIELKGKTSADAKAGPGQFEGVLNLKDKTNQPIPIVLKAPVDIQAAAPKATPTKAASQPVAPTAPKPPSISLLYAMLLAFIGGLLLNGMPCVFPVLTLKLSALAEMATASRKTMATQALAYTAGIVVSMLALAGVIIALRVAGTQVGWGFQFQNPWYLTAQCALLVLFAVNLFGGFEVLLPVNINIGAMNVSEDGVGRSFFEGLLCVLLATPCTAPLMGTAIGFALSSSTAVILAIFVTLGLGLASPFLLLVAIPGWRKWIPKPGNWLNRLKQLMGFSLIGTSAWLIWVVGSSYGVDGMFRLMMFLVVLSISGWAFGVVQFGSGWKKRLVMLGAIAAVLGAGWGLLRFDDTKPATQKAEAKDGWVAFDEARIKAAQQNGQPVFVDFTADWCISCKVNERTVLASDDVQTAIKTHNILMMKADWTRRDERIRLILSKYGKAGVPMYLVYSPHQQTPEVLPEVLTPSLVVKALARAAKSP